MKVTSDLLGLGPTDWDILETALDALALQGAVGVLLATGLDEAEALKMGASDERLSNLL